MSCPRALACIRWRGLHGLHVSHAICFRSTFFLSLFPSFRPFFVSFFFSLFAVFAAQQIMGSSYTRPADLMHTMDTISESAVPFVHPRHCLPCLGCTIALLSIFPFSLFFLIFPTGLLCFLVVVIVLVAFFLLFISPVVFTTFLSSSIAAHCCKCVLHQLTDTWQVFRGNGGYASRPHQAHGAQGRQGFRQGVQKKRRKKRKKKKKTILF
jgi:hypothetical protein